jgi:hypothetical protein
MRRHEHLAGFELATRREYSALKRKGIFQEVTPEVVAGSQALPLMWVFTYKFDTEGYLLKYKARLVVRGDLQVLTAGDIYAATLAARVF